MSPNKAPLMFKRPVPGASIDEAKARELEARAEARGNGVAGQPPMETVMPSPTPAATRDSKLRRDGRGVRIAGYVPAELEHELRMHCARARRSMSDALTEAVRVLLERSSDTEI